MKKTIAIFVTLTLLVITLEMSSIAYAACYKATDSAAEFGLDQNIYRGHDNPDNKWESHFAPMPNWHDLWWYDYSESYYCDVVVDNYIQWTQEAADWLDVTHIDFNLVWELQSYPYNAYEAYEQYIDTNIDRARIDHIQDSSESEEEGDGYEEFEIGSYNPQLFTIPGQNYYIITYWIPLGHTSGYFVSETELCRDYGFLPWYPWDWDENGRMNWDTNNSCIW